ncbi:MAG: STAS domain-containing protein [Gammaproteobacteria bacterium]|nr:STAS domain-containing protein [Gammaproteobacteria bacterium]MCP5138476.1 STAS domain-containing protein [Chromatiales bacterium]
MTTTPELRSVGTGQLRLSGPLVFATAGELLDVSRRTFVGDSDLSIDLGGVTKVDSAGLALLLEWLRWGQAERRSVSFTHLPDKLLAIARLSGVEEMLVTGNGG